MTGESQNLKEKECSVEPHHREEGIHSIYRCAMKPLEVQTAYRHLRVIYTLRSVYIKGSIILTHQLTGLTSQEVEARNARSIWSLLEILSW